MWEDELAKFDKGMNNDDDGSKRVIIKLQEPIIEKKTRLSVSNVLLRVMCFVHVDDGDDVKLV